MLTDTKLRNLKPKSKLYKASDRDGMYVTVSPIGIVEMAESHFTLHFSVALGADQVSAAPIIRGTALRAHMQE